MLPPEAAYEGAPISELAQGSLNPYGIGFADKDRNTGHPLSVDVGTGLSPNVGARSSVPPNVDAESTAPPTIGSGFSAPLVDASSAAPPNVGAGHAAPGAGAGVQPHSILAPNSVGALIYPPAGIGTLPPQMISDPRYRDPEFLWKHRHELYPNLYDVPDARAHEPARRKPPRRRLLFGKLVFSVLLFALVWGLFQLNTTSPWALKTKQYVQSALTDDFQFNAIAAWYERHFQGAPSLIPAFGDKHSADDSRKVTAPAAPGFVSPAKGTVIAAFNAETEGVTVQTALAAPVKAAAAGVVVSVGIQEGQGLTVVIRHSGQYETTYGQLASAKVNKNDWVAEGAVLGQASDNSAKTDGRLYFAVSRNNRYIDPADVVAFD
jgi:stage IV sporulation protein FA